MNPIAHRHADLERALPVRPPVLPPSDDLITDVLDALRWVAARTARHALPSVVAVRDRLVERGRAWSEDEVTGALVELHRARAVELAQATAPTEGHRRGAVVWRGRVFPWVVVRS